MSTTKASLRLDKKPHNDKMSLDKGRGHTPALQEDACATTSVVLYFTIMRENGKCVQ